MQSAAISSPFDSLVFEHGLMTRGLDALEAWARDVAVGHYEAMEDLGSFATFFSLFGELTHHVKEEDVMVPYLVRIGFSYDSGCLSQVRSEHDQERYLVGILHQAAEQQESWSREGRRHVLASILAFVNFQREHIRLEETVLFPEIMERVTDEQSAHLAQLFHEFDASALSRTTLDRMSTIAEDLTRHYAPVRTSPLGLYS